MKIGLIGCGIIAQTHAGILHKIQSQAHISVCDINLDLARQFASQIGAQGGAYTSIENLLDNEKPDTVHILTPVQNHFEAATKALEAGCHVYLEKPMTETPDEYRQLMDLAKEKNRVLSAGYSTLGMPVVMKAKSLIDSGDFGRLIAVHCDFMCAWDFNHIPEGRADHWTYKGKGGILQNMVDHPASLVLDVLDGVDSYQYHYAHRNVLPYNRPDLLHISMQNADQIGSFTLSLGHGNGHRVANYYLENGTITIDMTRQVISVIRGSGPPGMIKKILSSLTIGWSIAFGSIANIFKVIFGKLRRAPGIFALVENFYQTVEGKDRLLVTDRVLNPLIEMLDTIWNDVNQHPLNDVRHINAKPEDLPPEFRSKQQETA